MEAFEIPGIVEELNTALAQLKETAGDKESDLHTMEEDIAREIGRASCRERV